MAVAYLFEQCCLLAVLLLHGSILFAVFLPCSTLIHQLLLFCHQLLHLCRLISSLEYVANKAAAYIRCCTTFAAKACAESQCIWAGATAASHFWQQAAVAVCIEAQSCRSKSDCLVHFRSLPPSQHTFCLACSLAVLAAIICSIIFSRRACDSNEQRPASARSCTQDKHSLHGLTALCSGAAQGIPLICIMESRAQVWLAHCIDTDQAVHTYPVPCSQCCLQHCTPLLLCFYCCTQVSIAGLEGCHLHVHQVQLVQDLVALIL